MHSKNVPKCRVTWCHISTTSFPFHQISIAEHVGESGFLQGVKFTKLTLFQFTKHTKITKTFAKTIEWWKS